MSDDAVAVAVVVVFFTGELVRPRAFDEDDDDEVDAAVGGEPLLLLLL